MAMAERPYELRSGQRLPHPDLDRVLRRHLAARYRRPIAEHNQRALARLADWTAEGAPLIVDAGCGTAESTAALAAAHPTSLVVGVDRSLFRLRKSTLWKARNVEDESARDGNCALLRADLEDLWAGLATAGLRCSKLFLLYPNPYPKPGQLKRRWHGHPIFPALLHSCEQLELRCSWRVYADELASACQLVLGVRPAVERFRAEAPLSAFERKYWQSGTETFRVLLASTRAVQGATG